MVRGDVRVLERLLDRRALLRVEREGAVEEVERLGRRLGEEGGERPALADRQGADVVARAPGCDRIELVERRRANHIEDEVELVPVVPAGEEWPAREEFREDAADGPDVDRLEGR